MRFSCEQQALNAALSLVSRCIPSRPTHPILANIHLETVDDSKLRVTGFDLSLGISIDIDADIDKPGKITAPAKLILDIISKLPVGQVYLSVADDNEQGLSVNVTPASSGGNFSIRAIAASEYPEFPEVTDPSPVSIPAGLLLEGISKTVFSTSSDEAKQVLVGVHMEVVGETLEMAATDGHRLSVVTLAHESESPLEVTIPSRSLSELQRLLAKKESAEAVEMVVSHGMAKFQVGDSVLVTRTREGTYPQYRQLIPRQFARNLVCDRKQLSAALDRIGVLASNNMVVLEIDSTEQTLVISCEVPSVGAAKESMSVQVSGEPISLGMNIKYLREGLNAMSAKEVIINLNENLQPVIINPLDATKMTYLCMPVQLRS